MTPRDPRRRMTPRNFRGGMKRVAIVLLAIGARTAAADPVAVKVTEVAGGVVYVTPGRAAGLVPGTSVRFRGRDFAVVEVTENTAALRADNGQLGVGDSGVANVKPGGAAAVKVLDKPHAADTFSGQWPEPIVPAQTQNPTPVALGSGRAPGRAHVTVIGHGFGVAARGGSAADLEGRVIASFDLMTDRPLAADLDVAGRVFSNGFDKQTRVPVFVRAAQFRYGDASDPRFALGRLRWAASSVGMLDGARASARFSNFEVAAFGGMVPDPLSGKPDTSASRFGGEFAYDNTTAPWQPRLAIAAYGSTWSGKLDERRLTAMASASHESVWIDGWAEAQSFASDNPWNAKAVELTGAGTTIEWRHHGAHAGADLNFLRPARSLRLAAVLPAEWLCTLAPKPGDVAETCAGSDFWTSATASAGFRNAAWSVDAIGTFGVSHGVNHGRDSSGYLRAERQFGWLRFEAGVSGGKASFASWTAGELGVRYVPTRRFDVAGSYRPELLDYAASTGPILLHSLVGDGHYALSTVLDLAVSAIATVGADRDALALLATVVWRPLP
ncbi:MAG: hypothetical protein JWO36_266 [Myxococcales bacterium]|nr:hypothetical protein [Myxococcales bacterium]